ncbi:hypothetical protein [Flavobacterium degerlachei]|jgi:hypothetical protein|uniref:Uncharacterized protein n=1 Tax=Flavobacterium degerlachei TaxID=229203 RepID=A0A1H3D1J1_9FLAO|nr:hypothetical protein [Flavobacterium degerlachei]SDX59654.1 hypothetical protein SAMN05444338_11256 [Flavobacterium degerlachei]
MAGYLFSLDSIDSLMNCIDKGTYSTRLSLPSGGLWKIHHEGTFADYSSMAEGDNVYFFIKRKIYGIGILINISGECKFLNYPKANYPDTPDYDTIKSKLILDNGSKESLQYRFVCTFKPSPYFFKDGIDMDETLASAPNQFKILRAFWKLSFIKFSDEENQAFKNIILRRNIEVINNSSIINTIQSDFVKSHLQIEALVSNNSDYRLTTVPFLNNINNPNGSLKHEMAIEASLIHQLTNLEENAVEVFGKWDYLTHQIIASPFKPIDYMDKMDIFGYKYIKNQKPTISNFLVIEIKKGQVEVQDVMQLMKYVDWIKNEYTYGDYSMINAFLLGHSYTQEAIDTYQDIVERKYINGVRPSVSKTWNNVRLVTYNFDITKENLIYEII